MGRKSTATRLQVILNGEGIGILERTAQGPMEFTYDPAWLEKKDAIPASHSLPLREDAYRGAVVEAYFDNLLPDNDDIRRRIADRMATAGRGTMDLLAAIGRDCIGALQFLPEGETAQKPGAIKAERIGEKEIADVLRHLKSAPLGLDREREFRISIAGAQEKTAFVKWEGRWHRPRGSTPTTHIFKPAMGELPNGINMSESVANEWLCLKLAEHFGLPVAKVEIETFDDIDCLVVERFDREWSDGGKRLKRIPQEDLCQALGVPWSRKYQSDGGPGVVDIMSFLDASDAREEDRSRFLRAQLVFFLLGAIDGHAKNFSIRLLPTGFRMTPIYDVMTVLPALAARQIEPKQTKLGMSVGDGNHYRLGEIQRRHWDQTAKKSGFSATNLQALIDDLRERTKGLDDLAGSLAKTAGEKMVTAVFAGIRKQWKAL